MKASIRPGAMQRPAYAEPTPRMRGHGMLMATLHAAANSHSHRAASCAKAALRLTLRLVGLPCGSHDGSAARFMADIRAGRRR